jgi:hypothetical protein
MKKTNKPAKYKDKPPFSINDSIEKKFKDNYNKCLKAIFVNLSHKIAEFNK